MNELINKFVSIESEISKEKGDFALFALFLREDAFDKWDLVVAAPWIEVDRKAALPYIAKQIQAKFKQKELTTLSRIVLIEQSNPALNAINQAMIVEHGSVEVLNNNFFGLPIKHAYIITSKKLDMNIKVPAV